MEPERISFPTEYPIKVIARAGEGLRQRLDELFARHFGEFHAHRVSERASAQSSFVSFTYLMEVKDAAQLAPLNEELRALEGVIMVL
jgi:putative lipoic acid-binding regulatory protein